MYKTILDFKIDFSYDENKEKVLNNVVGSISKGQCVALCGESGWGDYFVCFSRPKKSIFYNGE